MTTELKKDEASGRYWLCESSEMLAKPVIAQDLKESLKVSNGKAGTLIVKNIPVTILNRENMNGRIYSTQVVQEAIDECKRLNKFADKSMLGRANEHPSSSFIAPSDASHAVINCYIKRNIPIVVEGKKERHDVLFQDWEIFNTHNGKDLRALVEAGASFGTSIRGLGDLEGKYVRNYSLISCDCVGNPSSSTFSGMPVAESIVESTEIKDKLPKQLNEEFVVSSSSTTVLKDIDQAADMAITLDKLGYGTVVSTSTKLDSETDPKTGVETTLVTFEAETEDKVTDVDTALMLAKRAILNGKVNIDSVTIENIKEDEKKESTEHKDSTELKEDSVNNNKYIQYITNNIDKLSEKQLERFKGLKANFAKGINDEEDLKVFANSCGFNIDNEDDTERYGSCAWCGDILPMSELKKEKDLGYICNRCAKGLESREDKLNFEDEYVPESKLIEAGEHYPDLNPNSPHNIRDKRCRNISETLRYYIDTPSIKEEDKNLAKDLKDKYVKAIHSDMSNEDLDEVLIKIEDIMNEKLINPTISLLKKTFGMNEATEEKTEDPNEGKKFVIKTPAGFVSMDGNALVFKEDPKEALHFIKGKENTGLVHLSEVEKILDTMGVYDVEKYFKKDTTDISVPEEGNGIKADNNAETEYGGSVEMLDVNKEESVMTEDNGSNTRFSAEVAYDKGNGNLETNTVPVSGVELDSILAEVGNLYDMKSQKATGPVSIKVTDTQTGEVFNYNKENNSLDPIKSADTNMIDVQTEPQLEMPVQEANGEIEQNKNELKVNLDKDHSITKKFDTTAQASIAKAGIEQGKLSGDVMLSEDDKADWKIAVVFNNLHFGEGIYNNADPISGQTIFNGEIPEKVRVYLYPEELDINDPKILATTENGIAQVTELAKEKLTDKLDATGDIYSIREWKRNEYHDVPDIFDTEKELVEANTQQYQDAPDYGEENVEYGWYALSPVTNTEGKPDLIGPFKSEDEANNMLGEVKDLVKVFEVTPDGIKQGLAAESSEMNEVIYSNPGKASDDFIEVPLKDSEDNKVTIKLNNIDWDIDSVVNKFYNGESIDIDELPDTLECDIDLEDYANIPVEDIDSIISLVNDKVFEKTGLRINNADYIAA